MTGSKFQNWRVWGRVSWNLVTDTSEIILPQPISGSSDIESYITYFELLGNLLKWRRTETQGRREELKSLKGGTVLHLDWKTSHWFLPSVNGCPKNQLWWNCWYLQNSLHSGTSDSPGAACEKQHPQEAAPARSSIRKKNWQTFWETCYRWLWKPTCLSWLKFVTIWFCLNSWKKFTTFKSDFLWGKPSSTQS